MDQVRGAVKQRIAQLIHQERARRKARNGMRAVGDGSGMRDGAVKNRIAYLIHHERPQI